MSLRGRVTLLATAVAAVVLVCAALATYAVVHDELQGDALTHLRIALAAGCAGGTLVAAILARLYARRAGRPVTHLASSMAHVRQTGGTSRRLHAGRDDEVGRLAAEYDAVPSSLERAREAQRRLVSDAARARATAVVPARPHRVARADRAGVAPALQRRAGGRARQRDGGARPRDRRDG